MSSAGTVTFSSRARPSDSFLQPASGFRSKTLLRLRPVAGPGRRHWRSAGNWCGRRDLNPHDFRHQILNLACLPIPPRPRIPVPAGPSLDETVRRPPSGNWRVETRAPSIARKNSGSNGARLAVARGIARRIRHFGWFRRAGRDSGFDRLGIVRPETVERQYAGAFLVVYAART